MLRTRLLRVLVIMTTGLVGIVAGASSASASVPAPDPAAQVPGLYVDLSTTTGDGGMAWWGIALIAVAAACVAGIVTELVDTVRQRRHTTTSFGHA